MHILTFSEYFADGYPVNESDTLYVIVDGDKCSRENHDLHDVPLNIKYVNHTEKLEGRYCRTCRQAQISRNLYVELNSKYGFPLCKTVLKGLDDVVWQEHQPDYTEFLDSEFRERAQESELYKLGYTVSSSSNLSTKHRQMILKNAIDVGAVSKGYVISHLSHLIKINGKKASNEYAVKKWQADLEFVLKIK